MATASSPQSLFGANASMRRLESQFELFQTQQGEFASQINAENRQTSSIIATIETTIRDREEAIRVAFDHTAAQRAAELASVVADARSEFDKQRQLLQDITSAVQLELNKLQQQIEQGSSKDGGNRNGKSFLLVKELKPPKLGK